MQTFHLHSTRVAEKGGIWEAFRSFVVFFLGKKWWPIFFLTILLLGLAARHPADNPTRLSYWLAGTFLAAGLASCLGAGSSWYVIFILFLLAAAVVKKISRTRAMALELTIAALMLLANSTKLIEAIGFVTGKIDTQPPANRAAILAMRPTKEHPVLVDVGAGRYAFDYKIPPGFIDFDFAAPFPGVDATTTKLRTEDTYVLGPSATQLLDLAAHTHHDIEGWNVLGFRNWTFYRHPREAYIIPAHESADSSAGGNQASPVSHPVAQ
jgi:hypothetical protein